MQKYDYDAIVIGAGVGGISCGATLAKKGLKTIIIENHSEIGGYCSTFESEGFQFDTGACIVEFPEAYDKIFENLGRKREDYIEFRGIEPLYSFRTTDGEYIDIPTDINKMYESIKQYSKRDAKNWLKFCDYCRGMQENGMDKFLDSDMLTWKSMANMFDSSLIKYIPMYMTTYETLIRRFFSHQKTLDTFGFQSYWIGLPPRLCPGMYAVVNYAEHEGIYYPKGGMISIPAGLLAVGKEYGLEIKMKTKVTKVLIENGRACGVELKDGTKLTSRLVVSNINAISLYLNLIGEEHLPRNVVKGVKSYKLSIPMPAIYLGIKGDVPLRAHHSLQLGRFQQMNKTWDEGFVKNRFVDEPICMICCPTITDPALAPKGHHAMTLLSMGTYKLDHGTWDDRKEEFIDRVLGFVDKTLWPGIRSQIVYKQISTPLDFERKLLSPQGAVFAIQNDIPSTMVFRPANRSKSIKGLYLVGASTHPGGGVPSVAASGKITSNLIMEDWADL
ncbi:MAG: NAD(P)/FAD-dependent oxidoreductase [Spirochaetes bacterium]|jgi:phytoene desaturase|nr:NAD(P)/FAD-dependent oxidoreductase [Spirochaetota bacterium]